MAASLFVYHDKTDTKQLKHAALKTTIRQRIIIN